MFDTIKRWFSALLRSLWGFLKQVFSGSLEIILAQLKDIAIQIVQEVENDHSIITDEAKRKEAFKRIKAYALTHGIEAKDSIINLIIELAVAYLKTKL